MREQISPHCTACLKVHFNILLYLFVLNSLYKNSVSQKWYKKFPPHIIIQSSTTMCIPQFPGCFLLRGWHCREKDCCQRHDTVICCIGKYDQEKSLFYMWSHSFRFDTWSVWIWHNLESFSTCEWVKDNLSSGLIKTSVSPSLSIWVLIFVLMQGFATMLSPSQMLVEDHWYLPIVPRACSDRLFDKWSIVIVSKGERIV